jgi:hypothetical protein
LLVERLKHTPPEQHEAIMAFKVFAFEGQVARASAEIDWTRRGLALIERLRHSGAREATETHPRPGERDNPRSGADSSPHHHDGTAATQMCPE